MAEKTVYSLTTSSLAALGILDEVNDFYLGIKDFCASKVEKNKAQRLNGYFFDITDIKNGGRVFIIFSKVDAIRESCREEFRRRLISFCNEHFMFFSSSNPAQAIRDLDMSAFWLFTHKKATMTLPDENGIEHTLLGFHASYLSFTEFIKNIEYYIACAIRATRLETEKWLTTEDVIEEINGRIDVIVKLKRESAVTECTESGGGSIDVYVFKSLHSISCNLNKHTVVPYVCEVPLLSGSKQVAIPAHRCKTCGRVFVGERMLEEYAREYGPLFVRRFADGTTTQYSEFALESKLHSLGYNVVDGELSDQERRNLLKVLLERNAITYLEACRDIENAINMFQERRSFAQAVKKWKSDLKYIGDLQFNHQE